MVVSDKWLQAAMRRAGHNPTDIEVLDIINKIDNDSGGLDFQVPYLIKKYTYQFVLTDICNTRA